MKTHRHIATPYELAAANKSRLNAIIVPLVPEPSIENGVWDFWTKNVLLYRATDRLYLAEKWCKGDWGAAFDDDIYFTESTTPEAENIGWQSADTMPKEATQYWYEIKEVRVCKTFNVGEDVGRRAGLHDYRTLEATSRGDDIWDAIAMERKSWNTAYPDHLWDDDHWVIVLTVEPLDAQS